MEIRKSSGLLACAAILALTLLSGCGGSKTTTTIPQTATVFYAHNLVFRNNTALTMGYNGFGQLGTGNLTGLAVATVVPNTGPVNGGALGGVHTLAFGNRTTVMAWGYNLYGQLGSPLIPTGNTTTSFSATPVRVIGFNGATVTGVAAGGLHSLAVAGGAVYGWGYNAYGQLGNHSSDNAATPVKVLDAVGSAPLTGATQVAAGGNHSLALVNGTVWAWGRNNSGQLGLPVSVQSTSTAGPVLLPDAIVPATGTTPASTRARTAIYIAAEGNNSYALADDFTVWAWGYNGDGELGVDPLVVPFSTTPLQVWKDAARTVQLLASKISAGGNHVLAMQSDGTLWAWGYNGFGQLGDGKTVDSFLPVQVAGLPVLTAPAQILDIRAFGDYSMFKSGLPGDVGKWYAWGDNGSGQLGNTISTSSLSRLLNPTLVQGY
jgi:hypothetical protein